MHTSCEQMIQIEKYLNDVRAGILKIAYVDHVVRKGRWFSYVIILAF